MRAGFTLIEVVVCVAILALVLFPLYEFLGQGTKSWEVGNSRTEVMQNARVAASFITDELRNARALYTIGPREVRFWFKDLNANKTPDPNEIITYFWSGVAGEGLMRRLDSEPEPTPLAFSVDSWALSYWDANGNPAAVTSAVRIVSLDITTSKRVRNDTYVSPLRTSVFIRNAGS